MGFHPRTININIVIIIIVFLTTRRVIGVAIESAFISDRKT